MEGSGVRLRETPAACGPLLREGGRGRGAARAGAGAAVSFTSPPGANQTPCGSNAAVLLDR